MFDSLSSKLQNAFKNLRGLGKISETNIGDSLREVRLALLEAALLIAGRGEPPLSRPLDDKHTGMIEGPPGRRQDRAAARVRAQAALLEGRVRLAGGDGAGARAALTRALTG
jgi:hypothetical protein